MANISSPSIQRFVEFARQSTAGGVAQFWDCKSAFQEMIRSGSLSEAASSEIEALAREPLRDGPWLQSEWQLHRDRQVALSVAILSQAHRFIHVIPHLAMVAPIGTAALQGNRYLIPPGYRNDVFDPSLQLIPDGEFAIQPGEVLCIDSESHAYDYRIDRPILIVRCLALSVYMQEWLFKRDNLTAWQANDADLTFTQLRVSADVLGRFAHQSSERALKKMAAHPHHAVRWAAIQNLGRISKTSALALLRKAVDDPHPHIRAAARKTVSKLDNRGGD